MAKDRLGVIVPYRNRYPQLVEFKAAIEKYLTRKKINYRLIIVEQDDAKLFNRGTLLNIGFKEAKKHKCNYVCFHDVDMIPSKVDYSYSENPVHLAHTLINYDNTHKPIFDQYFGGVTKVMKEETVCGLQVCNISKVFSKEFSIIINDIFLYD